MSVQALLVSSVHHGDACLLAAGGRRVRVRRAGVRVLRLLRALCWEEGLPGCRHGALHSSGNYTLACPLFLADRVSERPVVWHILDPNLGAA